MPIILSAPAKLNLFLHIVGRRTDGYHELQTVFQFLDFSDHLHFELRLDGEIKLHTDLNIPCETNLVWQAAKKLQLHTHSVFGADIHLQKRLPLGAGLGGGSSNAATTLVALNRLWGTQLSTDSLAVLGQQLGADVPVFIRGQASWAEGIGEILTPLLATEAWYVVLIPRCVILSAEIFAHPQLTRGTPRIKMTDFEANPQQLGNDFQPLVRKLYPLVAEALDWLGQFAKAQLTGSGSAIFAAFPEQAVAERIFSQKPDGLPGFVTKSMNRSPLFFELDKMAGSAH